MAYYWWLIIALALFVIEILTPGFVIMWFGVGALVAALLSIFRIESLTIQIVSFVVVSLVLVILSRTIFKNVFIKNSPDMKTNADVVLGKIGIVTDEIDNNLSTGRILIEGQDWSARSDDSSVIAKDEKIVIIKWVGATLIVKKI